MPKNFIGKWKRPALIFVVAFAIIFALIATKPEAPTRPSSEKVWQVSAALVSRAPEKPEVELFARSESPHETKLSTTLAADVVELPALIGDQVKANDVIVKLDDTDARAAVIQAEADISELKARIEAENNRFETDKRSLASEQRMLEIANEALARQQKLNASQLVAIERKELAESSAMQIELAITNREQSIKDHSARLAQLEASLKRAEARLMLARRDLAKTQIRAPFAGHITAVHVSPGERVQSGQVIAEMYDSARVEYKAQIPNSILLQLESSLASNKPVTARYNNQRYQLQRLSSSSNEGHGGRDAWFTDVDETNELPLNQSIKLIMQLPTQDGLIALPISAIYGTNRIFRIKDDRLEALSVVVVGNKFETGKRDLVLIQSSELSEGDQVITTQLPKAVNGLKVSVQGTEVSTL